MTIQVAGNLLGIPVSVWFGVLLSWTLLGSLMLVLGMLLQRFLAGKSASLRSLVWLLIFAAVILIPLFQGALDRVGPVTDHQRDSLIQLAESDPVWQKDHDARSAEMAPTRSQTHASGAVATPANLVTKAVPGSGRLLTRWQDHWITLVLVIWLIGGAFYGTRLLRDLVTGWLVRRAAWDLDGPVLRDEVAQVCRDLDLQLFVDVRLHDSVTVPLVIGWRRPTLILPAQAMGWEREVRRATLVHEMAHIKRLDLLASLLLHLACLVLWFQPLMWHCARRAFLEMEIACDDWVLRQGTPVRTYASHLLRIATQIGRSQPRLAGVRALAEPSPVSERMIMILDKKIRREPVGRGSGYLAALLIAVACCSVASLPVVAEENPQENSATVSQADLVVVAQAEPGTAAPAEPADSAEPWSIRVDPEARQEIQALLAELKALVEEPEPDEARRTEVARRFLASLNDQLQDKYRALDIYQVATDSQFVMVQVSVDRVDIEDDEDLKIVLRISPEGEDSFSIFLPTEPAPEKASDQ